jgi:lysophospholipase L1-like esterase
VAFRALAVLLGLLPLALLEMLCVVFGWGAADPGLGPYEEIHVPAPLFELNSTGERYQIAVARQEFFRPDSFAARKGDDEFRIFCLGGSTVQGRPYSIETSFTTWLELHLRAADRRVDWDVVNCGGVSYASYRLLPILREVLQYEPDLIVLCTGHNEFLEDRSYRRFTRRPAWIARGQQLAAGLRTYRLLHAGYWRLRAPASSESASSGPVLPTEVQAVLDSHDGLAVYHRDETWRRAVIAHYGFNLERMLLATEEAGVPTILVNPVSNLRDCPPFKSQHRAQLRPEEEVQWKSAWNEAREHYGRDIRRSLALLQQARHIDDQYAGLHYQLGQCYDVLGDTQRARYHFLQAKELDICPLRMLEPMHRILHEVARDSGVALVDARQLIERRCRAQIADDSWMLDHVHPSIRGHQLIADALAETMVREGIFHPDQGWSQRRDDAYQQQLDSLDELYFQEGKRRLEGLRVWARGREE